MFLSTLLAAALFIIGLFFFSFVFWKKLREDYPNEHIFTFTLLAFLGGILGWWLSSQLLPGFVFWSTLVTGSAFALWALKRFEFRFFEVADSISPAWFWLSFFTFLGLGLPKDVLLLLESLVSLFSAFIYKIILSRYRTFSWYPSGKVGFAGAIALAFYFLLRASVAIFAFFVLSFSLNLFDLGANILLALILGLVVYLRSGKEGAERIISWRKS